MSRVIFRLRITVVAIVLSAIGWGQSSQPPGPHSTDAFADWHASTNDAADRALAAVLSERPWMQAASPAPAKTSTVANTADLVGRLRNGFERVRQLRPTIEPILRQEGVPTELGAIVLVESGGIPTALSPKGARGLWQLMPDTARRYGLVVSDVRDDRLDISRSSHAAARYLRDLYQQFGSWQLAFAAYNAGEQAVDRAVGRTGQRDLFGIQRALPQETRLYVPAVLQAMATLSGNTDFVSKAANSSPSAGRIIYASTEEVVTRN